MLESLPSELKEEIAQLNLVIVEAGLANILTVTPTLEEEIRKAQPGDAKLQKRIKSIFRRISTVPSDSGEGFACLIKLI